MDVWDPKDKTAVFWEIKRLISAPYQVFKGWLVQLHPGYLLFLTKDWLYTLCERYGGSLSCWGWNKRWNKRNSKRYKHG
tara:strand:+ start:1119 stop:1355 length:237 start_codon:yes stop_codon:yes gene_type:complete